MARAQIMALTLLAAMSTASAGVLLSKANSSIPITQVVKIEGVEVYSQSAGHDQLNQCTSFPRMFVNDPNKPSVTVCGTGTKVTVYLRNECEAYHHYTQVIGACNSKAASTTCVTESPATQSWMAHAQSYKIEQC